MEIRENSTQCIYAPLSKHLGAYETSRLLKELNKEERIIAIDLQYTEDCSIEFIEALKTISSTKKIGIFNIPSDIFAIFNYMNIDRCVKLFVNQLDFEEDERQIINRKFAVV